MLNRKRSGLREEHLFHKVWYISFSDVTFIYGYIQYTTSNEPTPPPPLPPPTPDIGYVNKQCFEPINLVLTTIKLNISCENSSDIANKIKIHGVFCSALHKSNMKSFQSALIKSSGEMSFPNTFAFFFNSAEFKVLEFHFLPALSYCISQKTGGNLKSCQKEFVLQYSYFTLYGKRIISLIRTVFAKQSHLIFVNSVNILNIIFI